MFSFSSKVISYLALVFASLSAIISGSMADEVLERIPSAAIASLAGGGLGR